MYEVISHCGFDLYFLMTNGAEQIFMYLWPFVYLVLKNVYSSLLPCDYYFFVFVVQLWDSLYVLELNLYEVCNL